MHLRVVVSDTYMAQDQHHIVPCTKASQSLAEREVQCLLTSKSDIKETH